MSTLFNCAHLPQLILFVSDRRRRRRRRRREGKREAERTGKNVPSPPAAATKGRNPPPSADPEKRKSEDREPFLYKILKHLYAFLHPNCILYSRKPQAGFQKRELVLFCSLSLFNLCPFPLSSFPSPAPPISHRKGGKERGRGWEIGDLVRLSNRKTRILRVNFRRFDCFLMTNVRFPSQGQRPRHNSTRDAAPPTFLEIVGHFRTFLNVFAAPRPQTSSKNIFPRKYGIPATSRKRNFVSSWSRS